MTVWNVSPIYYSEDHIRYTVLPYDLHGTISNYLKYDRFTRLIKFLMNCRLTEKSAQKYADKKMKRT